MSAEPIKGKESINVSPKGEQKVNASYRQVGQIAPPKEPSPPKQENKGSKK